MKKTSLLTFKSEFPLWLRLLLTAALAALLVGAVLDLQLRYEQLPVATGRIPVSFLFFALFAILGALFALMYIWASSWLAPLSRLRARLGWVRWIVVLALGAAPSIFLSFSEWSDVFSGVWVRCLTYAVILLAMVWLLGQGDREIWSWDGIVASLTIMGVVVILCDQLRYVLATPLSLSWSEGNRLWDYSVLFGHRLYDYPADKSIPAYIDIGRQSLWGLPFLFMDPDIWTMRLWNALVWTIPYILLGLAILKPGKGRWGSWLIFGGWALIFLTQGPIYSPLVLAAVLVALARRQPLWLAVILVMVAGMYARYTRYTWMFAPAMWAGMIWMLQAPRTPGLSLWKRWQPAFVVAFAGLAGGYIIPESLNAISRALYGVPFQIGNANSLEVNLDSISQNVTRQPLLWDRLWPNETYSMGIVFGLLLAIVPLLILLFGLAWKANWRFSWWQNLAIYAPMLAFLGVGLVVSVKIGGGSNLHNLDMFLIGLLFLSGFAWEYASARWGGSLHKFPLWITLILPVMLIIPVFSTMLDLEPAGLPDPVKAADAIGGTRDAAIAASKKGEVLFMDQRQLLTFGAVKGVPLVSDYEKKYMMDQAMSDNEEYFQPFIKDMKNHRFTLIVSEPLYVQFQGDNYLFGNENDKWVKWVSIPVLCYYEPVETYPGIVQLLAPRQKAEPPAPGVVCP